MHIFPKINNYNLALFNCMMSCPKVTNQQSLQYRLTRNSTQNVSITRLICTYRQIHKKINNTKLFVIHENKAKIVTQRHRMDKMYIFVMNKCMLYSKTISKYLCMRRTDTKQ